MFRTKLVLRCAAIALLVTIAPASPALADGAQTVRSIYWSDGDSGRVDGVKFRLADVDAPETGGVGAAIGAAECEAERELGFAAKEFMVELTRKANLEITRREDTDRYGRIVMHISANGIDVAQAGLNAGVLRPWPHDGGEALSEKPDWCGED